MSKKLFYVGLVLFVWSSSLAIAQYRVDLLAYYEQDAKEFPVLELVPSRSRGHV